jgi:hypothetical protein
MHGTAETFNSIFEELIFGVFLNTKVLAKFVFYLILFKEYCEFWRGKLNFGELFLVKKVSSFFF